MTDLRHSPPYEFGKKKQSAQCWDIRKHYYICISYALNHHNVYCLVDNCCVLYRIYFDVPSYWLTYI